VKVYWLLTADSILCGLVVGHTVGVDGR
jgi:hypothetical protein